MSKLSAADWIERADAYIKEAEMYTVRIQVFPEQAEQAAKEAEMSHLVAKFCEGRAVFLALPEQIADFFVGIAVALKGAAK
ncbi:hypothetical protein ACUH97_08095 [Dermabacteraceae bacterium P13088]